MRNSKVPIKSRRDGNQRPPMSICASHCESASLRLHSCLPVLTYLDVVLPTLQLSFSSLIAFACYLVWAGSVWLLFFLLLPLIAFLARNSCQLLLEAVNLKFLCWKKKKKRHLKRLLLKWEQPQSCDCSLGTSSHYTSFGWKYKFLKR